MPSAQTACAAQPSGCGDGLAGLDLANVAIVLANTAVKASEGKDWKSAFTPGGRDEYALYVDAQRKQAAQAAQRAAQTARAKARADAAQLHDVPRSRP